VIPPRVVLDTVVFVQALISNRGPVAACVQRARGGAFVLVLSQPLIEEMAGVPQRPELTRRYPHLAAPRAGVRR